MALKNSLEKLEAFKLADKYEAFCEVLPDVFYAIDDQKETISKLLNACAAELISILQNNKKPPKLVLKKVIAKWMDEISLAKVDNTNKDFAYELCWYLSDIIGSKLKLSSESHGWGYWKIAGTEVKTSSKKKARKKSL